MIITWRCEQCGWANDNNNGDCRRCGGNTEFIRTKNGRTKEVISKRRDEDRVKAFDEMLAEWRKNRADEEGGAKYDRR